MHGTELLFTGSDCRKAIGEFVTILSQPTNSPHEWPGGSLDVDMAPEGRIRFFSDCDDKTPLLDCRVYDLAKVVDFGEGRMIKISSEAARDIERLFFTP